MRHAACGFWKILMYLSKCSDCLREGEIDTLEAVSV